MGAQGYIPGMSNWTPDRYMNWGIALTLIAALLGVALAATASVTTGVVVGCLIGLPASIYLAIGIIGLGVRSANAEQSHADQAG